MQPDRVIAFRNNKIIYRGSDHCIKALAHSYPKSAIYSEAYRQTCAESTGLPVPVV